LNDAQTQPSGGKWVLKQILVPLDGSNRAEWALDLATALSVPTAAHLLLVRVLSTHGLTDLVEGRIGQDIQAAERYLQGVASSLLARGFTVDAVVARGKSVAESIVQAALEHDADLIALTTHGHTGPARWILGSVAEAVVGRSPVPVLIQRAWDPEPRALLLAEQPRILVPVDGSHFAEAALPPAISIADDLGAEILLVDVDTTPHDVMIAEQDVATFFESAEYAPASAEREYLHDLAQRLCSEWPGLTVRTLVRSGDPATALIAATRESKPALVVMATHGRTGLQRATLGSVADGVLQHGQTPLVLVHPILSGEPADGQPVEVGRAEQQTTPVGVADDEPSSDTPGRETPGEPSSSL
jgi:nucleotide-binding universal stress UspA family protein